MTFIKDQVDFVKSPNSYLKQLPTDSRAIVIGFRNALAVAILYEGAILFWALGADDVTLPAFLRIPEQQYYSYELIFLIPLFIVTWLLASAIAYVLSRAFGGSGSYDALLGGVGLTMAISAYFTLIPDYIQGILWTSGLVPFYDYLEITGQGILLIIVWMYMLMYTLSHIVLYSMTVHYTQSLGRFRSFIVGVLSFIVSFAVWITFVR
jgi:hypothetical protein